VIKRLILTALILLVIFGGIFGWKYYQERQMAVMMSAPPPPATIASAKVRSESWQPYLHSIGSVEATQGIFVTTEVPGQVREILFESGQKVEAGEVLLQLDDSVDQADLEGLAALSKQAKLRFERNKKLVKERSVSRSEYDDSLAQLENLQASVEAKRATIHKKKILAPFSGQLGIRKVDIGEYLSPGAHIVPLQALDPVYVDYRLPERHFDRVHVGQSVIIKVQAYTDKSFQGRVSAINPGIDPGTRSIHLQATLPNPGNLLRPGMFAEVRTVLPVRENILTLPRTAISYNPYGESVFVILKGDSSHTVQRRPVTTGEIRDGRVEILEGLQDNDEVVSAGQVKLRNGQEVVIDNSVLLDKRMPGG
jgi:membrane fusion protein (multidrug efflux system)